MSRHSQPPVLVRSTGKSRVAERDFDARQNVIEAPPATDQGSVLAQRNQDAERIDHAGGVSGVAGAIRFPPPEVAAASVADSGRGFPHRFSGVEPPWKDHLRASDLLGRLSRAPSVFLTERLNSVTFEFASREDALVIFSLFGKEPGQ